MKLKLQVARRSPLVSPEFRELISAARILWDEYVERSFSRPSRLFTSAQCSLPGARARRAVT